MCRQVVIRVTQTPDIQNQGRRLIELGVPELAGLDRAEFSELLDRAMTQATTFRAPLLVVHPMLVPAAELACLLERAGKPGFVVEDMTDLAEFVPIREINIPQQGLYAIDSPVRGDEMSNWSPAEALPEILGQGSRPLTLSEGISWLLQDPAQLEPGKCFMTIASRKPKSKGWDARTPALWISGGTGRDGSTRKGAPKVGWCWHNNRHTWLGFASCLVVGEPAELG